MRFKNKEDVLKMQFYATFQKIINDARDAVLNHELDEVIPSEERHRLLETEGGTTEIVRKLAPSLRLTLGKPQQLIHDDPDYYIANDMLTNTFYICYRTLLMVDIDFYKSNDSEEQKAKSPDVRQQEIVDKIKAYSEEKGWLFDIYRSRNGVHAFLINHSSDHQCDEDLQIMLDLECDFFYVVYSFIRGWSVRLNRKEREVVMSYEFISRVGHGHPDPQLCKLVQLHLNLVSVFSEAGPSTMYGT